MKEIPVLETTKQPVVIQEPTTEMANIRVDVAHETLLLDNVFAMLGAIPSYLEDEGTKPDPEQVKERWIIHIDDDEEIVEAIRAKMEVRGIKVASALDGASGVRTAFTKPADAIILDFEMPNGRGDYVLQRLKASPITCDIPVIVLSGVCNNELQRELLNMGAQAFLGKPYDFDELYELVTGLMGSNQE